MKFSIIATRRILERCDMPYREFRGWFIKFQVTGFELQDKNGAKLSTCGNHVVI